MLPISFARQSLVRLRPVQTSDHGNVSWDYTTPAQLTLTGFIISPLQSTEDNLNRNATMTQYQVLGPTGYDIKDSDHFRYNNKEYQIVGEVQVQPSPSGTMDHITFIMNRWEG